LGCGDQISEEPRPQAPDARGGHAAHGFWEDPLRAGGTREGAQRDPWGREAERERRGKDDLRSG